MFNQRQHRAHRIGRRTLVDEIGIPGLELTDLAVGAPLPVAVASVSPTGSRDPLQATTLVEARGDLEAESLVVDEAVVARGANGLLVQPSRVGIATLDARDLRGDQKRPIFEVFGAVPGPRLELP